MPLFGQKKNQDQTKVNDSANLNGKTRPRGEAGFVKSEPYIERMVWLGLKVADVMGESIFLENTLNLRFADEGNSGVGHHIRYNCGSIELELVEGGATWASRPKLKNGRPQMPLVASFTLDNITPAVEELVEKEVMITQVFDQDWTASALFLDPERNIWQLEEVRTAPPVGTTHVEKIGTIWLECQDLAQQTAFYRDVLGLVLAAEGGGPRPVTAQTEAERRHVATNEQTLTPETLDEVGPSDVAIGEVVFDPTETTVANPTEVIGNDENPPISFEDPPLLTIENESQLEDSLVGVNPETAVFFNNETRLALVAGGYKPENPTPRVWGRDVNFMLSFRVYDVNGLAQKIQRAGYAVTQPAPDPDIRRGLAFTFSDPEGNIWQAAQWPRLPV